MQEISIHPLKSGGLQGNLVIPPSKSHTQRALLFALMGSKISRIYNYLECADSKAMLQAILQLGAKIVHRDDHLEIEGHLLPTSEVIDSANSGQVLRFITAIAALLPSYTTITGDTSIRTKRPVKPLLHALRQLGALAESARGDGHAPLTIKGRIHPGKCHLTGEDSQPVSALLMATSFLEAPSEIFVENPGETPWVDLTLHWLHKLGAVVSHTNYTHYLVKGGLHYSGFTYTVPGDFSTAAFPLAAALITQSSLKLSGLDPEDVQGDKAFLLILQEMGAKLTWEEKTLCIHPTERLQGIPIDVNQCIDALPILAVVGCFAEGVTTLYNGAIARHKESDRIHAICRELKKMGADIEEKEDGLLIRKSSLAGAHLEAHQDHRIALALAVAALGAKSSSTLSGIEWVDKSYPSFIEDFQRIGAEFEAGFARV